MSWLSLLLPGLGIGSVLGSVIVSLFGFKVNRASAMKIMAEGRQIDSKTALDEAEKSVSFIKERFAFLEEEYKKNTERLDRRTTALMKVIDAIDIITSRVRFDAADHDEATIKVTRQEADLIERSVQEARRNLV